jgi:hypothetical protein
MEGLEGHLSGRIWDDADGTNRPYRNNVYDAAAFGGESYDAVAGIFTEVNAKHAAPGLPSIK